MKRLQLRVSVIDGEILSRPGGQSVSPDIAAHSPEHSPPTTKGPREAGLSSRCSFATVGSPLANPRGTSARGGSSSPAGGSSTEEVCAVVRRLLLLGLITAAATVIATSVSAASPGKTRIKHVLLISVDGLHQSDLDRY